MVPSAETPRADSDSSPSPPRFVLVTASAPIQNSIAAATYAEAYEAHREFYTFIRGLEALEKSVDEKTRLVIGTDSPVFRYLKEMQEK